MILGNGILKNQLLLIFSFCYCSQVTSYMTRKKTKLKNFISIPEVE